MVDEFAWRSKPLLSLFPKRNPVAELLGMDDSQGAAEGGMKVVRKTR